MNLKRELDIDITIYINCFSAFARLVQYFSKL